MKEQRQQVMGQSSIVDRTYSEAVTEAFLRRLGVRVLDPVQDSVRSATVAIQLDSRRGSLLRMRRECPFLYFAFVTEHSQTLKALKMISDSLRAFSLN